MGKNQIRTVIAIIRDARKKAETGVDYNPRYGAVCPCCGARRLRVLNSMPWDENVKVRYHRCSNAECVLGSIGASIKSVETAGKEIPGIQGRQNVIYFCPDSF